MIMHEAPHFLETPVGIVAYIIWSLIIMGLCFLLLWLDLKRRPRGK